MKGKPTKKFIPTLHETTKHVVHYHSLQQYLKLGLKLKKIHRAVSFKQSQWLQPYIALNTEKRKQAKNPFEKDFYKLMNNSMFGKTMENMSKRTNVQLCTTTKQIKRQLAKPEFWRFQIFNEELTGVQLQITTTSGNGRFPLRVHPHQVRPCRPPVHRHRQPVLPHTHGCHLQRHAIRCSIF